MKKIFCEIKEMTNGQPTLHGYDQIFIESKSVILTEQLPTFYVRQFCVNNFQNYSSTGISFSSLFFFKAKL